VMGFARRPDSHDGHRVGLSALVRWTRRT
jgi:hypothetical protein